MAIIRPIIDNETKGVVSKIYVGVNRKSVPVQRIYIGNDQGKSVLIYGKAPLKPFTYNNYPFTLKIDDFSTSATAFCDTIYSGSYPPHYPFVGTAWYSGSSVELGQRIGFETTTPFTIRLIIMRAADYGTGTAELTYKKNGEWCTFTPSKVLSLTGPKYYILEAPLEDITGLLFIEKTRVESYMTVPSIVLSNEDTSLILKDPYYKNSTSVLVKNGFITATPQSAVTIDGDNIGWTIFANSYYDNKYTMPNALRTDVYGWCSAGGGNNYIGLIRKENFNLTHLKFKISSDCTSTKLIIMYRKNDEWTEIEQIETASTGYVYDKDIVDANDVDGVIIRFMGTSGYSTMNSLAVN